MACDNYTKIMKKNLLTILYYTSNREDTKFEKKIIENLLMQSGGLPIISVSQKPINLGKNICVGNVGFSYLNEFRQILIGAREVITPFIISAESDFLYPKEYFTFTPPGKGIFFYDNIRVVFKDTRLTNSYRKKRGFSEGAQICDKDSLIKMYEELLAGKPQWIDRNSKLYQDYYKSSTCSEVPFTFFHGNIAAITFKTGDSICKFTDVHNGPEKDNRKSDLPFWGHIDQLRAKYL